MRTLLLLLTLVAFSLTIWLNYPSKDLFVQLQSDGTVLIDDREIDSDELLQQLKSEINWSQRWNIDPVLHITPHADCPNSKLIEIINETGQIGVEKWSFEQASSPPK
ncbi:MAG: hypothetical protein AAF483_16395 [Planctomycetota bacterium]